MQAKFLHKELEKTKLRLVYLNPFDGLPIDIRMKEAAAGPSPMAAREAQFLEEIGRRQNFLVTVMEDEG